MPRNRAKSGPKGPSQELIDAIVEMKRRNPRFGCPRIAQQIAYIFGIEIDKDVVRRVLAKHYHPEPGGGTGPSWLTVIGQASGALIYFAASPFDSKPTGYWWSWISSPGGSLASR
jgi:hypothetical protein